MGILTDSLFAIRTSNLRADGIDSGSMRTAFSRLRPLARGITPAMGRASFFSVVGGPVGSVP
jgi:hypothetical protein